MKLIVDSGSTKMEWILLEGQKVKSHFTTQGFNPNYSDIQFLENLIVDCAEARLIASPKEIHYYGTGCGSEQNCQLIHDAFQHCFPDAKVSVTHDLMAVCHALLGNEKGIACILGTGSNACVYDGERITERAVSLGYLVGDEGSGMHIGREVVRAYFYGFMPDDLKKEFGAAYHLELKDFIDNLYHQEQPSRYLASFARFAGQRQANPYIHTLARHCFDAFVEAFVCRFSCCKEMRIGFVGSVAYYFQDILKECLMDYGLTLGPVMQSPAEGLVEFYRIHQP